MCVKTRAALYLADYGALRHRNLSRKNSNEPPDNYPSSESLKSGKFRNFLFRQKVFSFSFWFLLGDDFFFIGGDFWQRSAKNWEKIRSPRINTRENHNCVFTVSLSLPLSLSLTVSVSVALSVALCLCLSLGVSISVSLSVFLSVSHSLCRWVSLSRYVCLSLHGFVSRTFKEIPMGLIRLLLFAWLEKNTFYQERR